MPLEHGQAGYLFIRRRKNTVYCSAPLVKCIGGGNTQVFSYLASSVCHLPTEEVFFFFFFMTLRPGDA